MTLLRRSEFLGNSAFLFILILFRTKGALSQTESPPNIRQRWIGRSVACVGDFKYQTVGIAMQHATIAWITQI